PRRAPFESTEKTFWISRSTRSANKSAWFYRIPCSLGAPYARTLLLVAPTQPTKKYSPPLGWPTPTSSYESSRTDTTVLFPNGPQRCPEDKSNELQSPGRFYVMLLFSYLTSPPAAWMPWLNML